MPPLAGWRTMKVRRPMCNHFLEQRAAVHWSNVLMTPQDVRRSLMIQVSRRSSGIRACSSDGLCQLS